MRFTETKSSLLFVLAAMLPSCGGQALDVGSNGDAGASASGGTSVGGTAGKNAGGSAGTSPTSAGSASNGGSDPMSTPLPSPFPDPSSCDAGDLPFQGAWTGYAQGEGHQHDFRLELAGNGDTPCGTITFGEPQAYGDATDPTVPYPASESDFKFLERQPGFTYTLLATEVDGARVQFRISYSEPYVSWCGLQTSYPNPNIAGYSCLPSYGDGSVPQSDGCHAQGGEEDHVYSCVHFEACLASIDPPCTCEASGCGANIEGSGEYFDLRFDETDASGEMSDKTVFLEKE